MTPPGHTLRLLAIIPHPDDETYGMAGTLALAARAGADVHVLCATRGEQGENFHPHARTGLAALRTDELTRSCALLGARPPRFLADEHSLGLPDGGLADIDSQQLAQRLTPVLRAIQPHVVLALGPDGAYGHADHLALTDAVTRAIADHRRPLRLLLAAFPPDLFLPQWRRLTAGPNAAQVGRDPPTLGTPAEAVGLRVDIRSVKDVKLAAIAAHRSQLPDGTPQSLFPPAIVDALLEEERFVFASGPLLPPHAADPFAGFPDLPDP